MKDSVRGQLIEDYPLGQDSWFRCGGHADLVFKPADFDDLITFLKSYPKDEPLTVQGGCANTIVREGGVRGCVVKLSKEFAGIEVDGTKVLAGTGALNATVALTAAKAGIGGLEYLSGIPGTIGGVMRMNAGSYGTETKDVVVEATAVDRAGNVHTVTPAGMGMEYRHNPAPADYIFTHAVFQGYEEDPDVVRDRLKDIKTKRQDSQPITEKTGGSTFANPEGHKSWQLIDEAGCRGLKIGGAHMSEKHCNFMINDGTATATDLEDLGEEVRRRVREHSGIELRWEIRRIGERPS